MSPPDQSLALVLADNDFDVWIVSSRGTKYSRGHVSLKPEDEVSLFFCLRGIEPQNKDIRFSVNVTILYCRLIGIGHGTSYPHMTFQLHFSMFKAEQGKNCTMLATRW